ncbi:MAG: hypothetical protein ACRD1V_17935 [Vicinamibacterales bacterium]
MPTNASQLIAEAKRLQRLLTRRRAVTKDLRAVNAEIRLVRKNVKALSGADAKDPFDQVPPLPWEKE